MHFFLKDCENWNKQCFTQTDAISKRNKAGYTATEVACGWAGAIFEVTRSFGQVQWGQRAKIIKKVVWPTDLPIDLPTDGQSGLWSCMRATKNLQFGHHFHQNRHVHSSSLATSDAGSQYRWGQVGRGIQPPSTPEHTNIHNKWRMGHNIRQTDRQLKKKTNEARAVM